MISNEKITVSMCVYGKDNPEHFKIAVDSILNQTTEPDEVVLVVDGPVPGELDAIISAYEENEKFNVIRLPENVGHGEARRIGLKSCKNELVALMDADDISLPRRFEEQLEAFRKDEELVIVGSHISEFIGEESNIVSYRRVSLTDEEIKVDMKKRCPMNQVTVMFRRSAVEKVGGYIDWYCEEDYYLWLRLMLDGAKFANCDSVLVNVRTGEGMYSRRGGVPYFVSEAKLQGYMLKNKVIGIPDYVINVAKRLIVQVLLPNKIRGFVFKKFAREAE